MTLRQLYRNRYWLFKVYCRCYNVHARLGFKSARAAWWKNPEVRD